MIGEKHEARTVFEGRLAQFSSFFLKLLNGSLIDTTALVDQVSSSCRFAGIDMSDDLASESVARKK